MKELSQADLVTMARNTEGTMVLAILGEDGSERTYCCNPTEEMAAQIAEDAAAEAAADTAAQEAQQQAAAEQSQAVQDNAEQSTENADAQQ